MTEEFNLSEKRVWRDKEIEWDKEGTPLTFKRLFCYDDEDVKEFIKRLRKNYLNHINKHFKTISAEFMEYFDKLAGEKLI